MCVRAETRTRLLETSHRLQSAPLKPKRSLHLCVPGERVFGRGGPRFFPSLTSLARVCARVRACVPVRAPKTTAPFLVQKGPERWRREPRNAGDMRSSIRERARLTVRVNVCDSSSMRFKNACVRERLAGRVQACCRWFSCFLPQQCSCGGARARTRAGGGV